MSKKINVSTIGLTTVTENIRAAIFKNIDISAPVDTIVESGAHNDRTWTFFGLEESINYTFKMQKLVGGVWLDIQGFYYTFTTDDNNILFKAPVTIQADVTIGFASGTNTFTFDGTGGKDDWRGFDIKIERVGVGTMKAGVDYNWDKMTGTLTLVVENDVFGPNEYFEVEFILQVGTTGGGLINNGKVFSSTSVISANYSILGSDFGNNLIIQGAGDYLDLTLPDIHTIPENKMLWIESGIGNHINAGLKTFIGSQVIDWLKGNLTTIYFGRCESLAIYKQIKADTTQVWRIHEPHGNWDKIGNDFHSYADAEDLINALLFDGGGTNGISSAAYARAYDFVLNLNASKVCNYSDWGTGTNYLKFSYKDPSTGLFHIPDTRDKFIRNASAIRDVGIYQADDFKKHLHLNGVADDKPVGDGNNVFVYGQSNIDIPGLAKGNVGNTGGNTFYQGKTQTVGGDETRPVNSTMNHFLIV